MTELAILFLVLFVISLIIAVVAIINAIKIDEKHKEERMQWLEEVMCANAKMLRFLFEIEKQNEGEENNE